MPPVLAIVPTYLRAQHELDVLVTCLVTLWSTAQDAADVLVVDDGSPEPGLLAQLEAVCGELGFTLHRKAENTGFASTVNIGLQLALDEGRDAVLVNSDIEFTEPGWLDRMVARTDTTGAPAAVVGGLLLFPSGLIQHGGIFFSDLLRYFDHRFYLGPGDLAEAQVTTRCPVTGALQFIRHQTLAEVGLYDEGFRLGYEDVDYCLRVFASGLECIYEPTVRAIHHEGLIRKTKTGQIKEWEDDGARRLIWKHRTEDFSAFVQGVA